MILASAVDGVTVRNGTLLGGSRGIEITSGARVVLEDLEVSGTSGLGIFLNDTTEYAIRRGVFRNTSSAAIFVTGNASPRTTVTVEDNLIESCDEGIRLEQTEGVAVLNNRLRDLNSHGIILLFGRACLVSRNTLEDIGLGIRLSASDRCIISHNVVSNASAGQTRLDIGGDDHLVLENLVTGSGGWGFIVGGDRNQLKDNVSNSNGGHGFAFIGDDNVYRGNTARGNSGTNGNPPACVAQCSADLCIYSASTGNTSNGDNYLPAAPCS